MTKNEEINNLVNLLIKYKKSYYNGNSEISDDQFDALENQLKELDPYNKYFNMVGIRDDSGYFKVKHKIPMLSMQKVKNPVSAKQWMLSLLEKFDKSKNPDVYNNYLWPIQPKIDGCSCCIRYDREGKFKYMATRGDGEEGVVVTYGEEIMKYNNLPLLLYDATSEDYNEYHGFNIELRGEFYLNQLTTKISRPLRNNVAGLIKRKELTHELKEVRICLYNVVNVDTQQYISYGNKFPKSINKQSTIYDYSTKIKLNDIDKIYDEYMNENRMKFPFETDGLVIYYPFGEDYEFIDSNYTEKAYHHYNLALKPASKEAITTVKNIMFNISRYGQFIPVLVCEPFVIDNVTITNISMTNCNNLIEKGIKINSKILCARANDVIPYCKEYLKNVSVNEKDIIFPTKCPECNTELQQIGKNLVCNNEFCPGALIERIDYFNKNVNIKGLSTALITKLIKTYRINEIAEFYAFVLTRNDTYSLIGTKTTENIRKSIGNAMENLNLKKLIAYGANIPSLGIKQLEKEEPFDSIDDLINKAKENPNSAVRRSIIEWSKSTAYYKQFTKLEGYLLKGMLVI